MEATTPAWFDDLIRSLGQQPTDFWGDLSVSLCRHALSMIQVTESEASPACLAEVIIDHEKRQEMITRMEADQLNYPEEAQSLARAASAFFSQTFNNLSPQAQNSVTSGLLSFLPSPARSH